MIELKHVTKIYGQGQENLCVLEDVSLTFARGKFTVLLGPSGSGKSTLLNLIAMLDAPTSGKIYIDGKEITALKSEAARSKLRLTKMGFVFQFDGLLPEFTLLENVDMPGRMCGKANAKKAQKLLERFGLGNMIHKFPADLSGYDLIVHCGACMFNRRFVLSRVEAARAAGVPMTNYGILIAKVSGILDKVAFPNYMQSPAFMI